MEKIKHDKANALRSEIATLEYLISMIENKFREEKDLHGNPNIIEVSVRYADGRQIHIPIRFVNLIMPTIGFLRGELSKVNLKYDNL